MKNFKRFLALVVVAIMAVATFAACGSEEESKTITIYLDNKSRGAIASYNDSPAMQELEKRLGFEIDFQHPVDTSTDKVSLMIQSGELPDVLFVSTYFYGGWAKSQLKEAAYDGTFLKLDDLIKEKAPNIQKFLDENPLAERTIRMYNEDGGIYAIPQVYSDNTYNYYDGYFVRKDWLEKVEIEDRLKDPANIRTIKDWETVLTAFVEQDPNGNGEKDEVGFSTFAYMSKFVFMPAFDVFNWNYYLNPDTNEITHGAVEPGMKEFITTISKWREKGLVNMDYATTTQETLDDLVMNNKLGAFYCDFNNTAIKYVAANPDMELVPVPMVENSKGQARTGKVGKGIVGGTAALISADSEYIDEVFKLFDYCYSEEGIALGNWGIEGDSYEIGEDGKKHFTKKITGAENVIDAYNEYTAAGVNGGIVCYYDNEVNIELNSSVSGKQKALQDLAKQYCADVDKCANLPSTATTLEEDDEITKVSGDLNTYIGECWAKFITGEMKISEFDAFVKKVNDLGMSRVLEIKQAGYERGLEQTQYLYDKAVEMGQAE